MDIHKLKAFVAVVEESNISRAAVRLNMQQPPLTRIIKGLEDELNAQLLKRLPRGVEATEAGKEHYSRAGRSVEYWYNQLGGFTSFFTCLIAELP